MPLTTEYVKAAVVSAMWTKIQSFKMSQLTVESESTDSMTWTQVGVNKDDVESLCLQVAMFIAMRSNH